ncbi:MAG TPA: ABC transporter substrate-binding protein [Caulobacter sp.]|nr:ABC transporter substrate-binding protein [Caulobacter sp.]
MVLNIGDQRGAIQSLLHAAGELDNVPYEIEWHSFPVGAPLVEAIKAGAVDFGYVGSSTVTFGLASGSPLKVISVWKFHGPGSGLLVPGDSSIHGLADLRGKKIAVVRGSPGHLLVIEALRHAGIPLDAVQIVNLTAGDAKAALSSGAVDAWAIWDPYLAIGEIQDHDRVLITSDKLTAEIETGVASDGAVRLKRAELTDFLARVDRAWTWSQSHPDEVAQAYAKDTGVPLDLARLVRGRMKVEVLPQVTNEAIAIHQKTADLYADIGLIPRHIDIAQTYDRSFVSSGTVK